MGASITINVDTSSLQDSFNTLLKKTADLSPLMTNIGEYLLEETKDRFHAGQSPDGTPWKPSERATRDGGKTLIDRGHLRDSIVKKVTNNAVTIGTNVVYAAIHQFGGKTKAHKITARAGKSLKFAIGGGNVFAKSVNHPGSDIPARPFLGVNESDIGEIKIMVGEHLELL